MLAHDNEWNYLEYATFCSQATPIDSRLQVVDIDFDGTATHVDSTAEHTLPFRRQNVQSAWLNGLSSDFDSR